MSWASSIPKELAVQPLPLVVLTGLDIKHNAIHKEIWDGFNARSNGQKFRYKLLDGDHEYPKCKNKRPIEFYTPKGIFKTNWFTKHLYLVPALVVVFFDLDWDEPNWKEKQMECATKVELVRHSLHDRNTRIILVLVQKHPSIPIDGDNVLTRERYPSLCTACSIKNNYLFLLHTELMHGYIVKLEEDAFTEPTQTYYTLEMKSVRFKRDSLVKVTHQYLFVRLAIKIAFFNEMKQDIFKAIEYYKQAYLSTLDIRFYDSNILEVKMVASMINYKLCKLFFEIKHPIDAIDQFRKHIDIFKIKTGPAELSFEHSAWLAKQFQVMGELFESAIEKGYLSAVQTQHPGFYFHSAANHCIHRRLNARELAHKQYPVASQWTAENPSPIDLINNLEFYGQRPWRQGQGMEVLDQQKETMGILCLQEIESKENLTPIITSLFKQAITHFQVFNCKRMKQYLSVCMAEEYYYAKDYQESLNIYVKVLNDYNNEHWWPIITSIMLNAIKCAYLIADITNYCLLCTEIIGKNILLSAEDKSNIQKNLLGVLANKVPNASYHQIDANLHSIEEASKKWTEELNKKLEDAPKLATSSTSSMDASQMLATHKIIPAHVYGMVPFVECKVRFSSRVYNSNQHCELAVYLRAECVNAIQFSRLNVRFSQSHYNQYCQVDEPSRLAFEPHRVYAFRFEFLPCVEDIGKELEVSSITLELGDRETRVLTMHWRGDCKNALAHEMHTIASMARMAAGDTLGVKSTVRAVPLDDSLINWDEIIVAPITSIVAKKSNIELKLEHKMPIFVDEYYAIKLTIENKEENAIENINLTAEFQGLSSTNEIDVSANAVDPKILHLWIGNIDKNSAVVQQTKSLPNIEPNKKFSEIIYVQIKEIKNTNLLIRVKYDVDVSIKPLSYEQRSPNERRSSRTKEDKEAREMVKCTCVQEDRLKLDAVNAFKFEFNLMSMQMKPIRTVRFGEPFLLMTEIKNQAPYTLKFKNTFLNLAKGVRFRNTSSQITSESCDESESFLKGEFLKPNEMATECFCLTVDNEGESTNESVSMCLGEYCVEWRRKAQGVVTTRSTTAPSTTTQTLDEEDEEARVAQEMDVFNVKSKISLPECKSETFPFLIEADMPTFGTLDKELRVCYSIKNKMKSRAIDIELMLDENEFFSISGKKFELMQILPNDSINYRVAMFPLQVGYCKLPVLRAKLNESGPGGEGGTSDLDAVIQNMVPAQIFIFPENIDSLISTTTTTTSVNKI